MRRLSIGKATFLIVAIFFALKFSSINSLIHATKPAAPIWSIDYMSTGRQGLAGASVGTKVMFAGGLRGSSEFTVVDIFDTSEQVWSTEYLSTPGRYGLAAASVGDKILFAGGANSGQALDDVEIYDNTTETWSHGHFLSTPKAYLAATTVGTKAMFASGNVDIYDDSTGEWTTAELSLPRVLLAATTVGSKAIFAGGDATNPYEDVVDIYDDSTGEWTTATLSVPRRRIAAASVGTKAMFAGGEGMLETEHEFSDAVDIYDDSTGEWTTAELSLGRWGLIAVTVGNKIFFAGGWFYNPTGHWMYSNRVDIYDDSTDKWSTGRLSWARTQLAATSVGDKGYFAGGLGKDLLYSNVVDIVEVVE